MKKRISNKKYNSAVGLISHLILTKPDAVRTLLKRYGVVFSPAPTRAQLIAQVVELLAQNNPSFNNDLSRLIEVHIQYKGRDMLALDRKEKSERSYDEEDQFLSGLSGLLGGVAKNLIGGVFKKKSRPSGSASATATGSQAAQIAKMKADMQRQMLEMEKQRREQEERRRKQEEEDRKRREEASKKKQTNMLIASGVVVITIVGITLAVTLRPKPQPQQIIQR